MTASEDRLRTLYLRVRAGKDPDTGNWHIFEEEFVALIKEEIVKGQIEELHKVNQFSIQLNLSKASKHKIWQYTAERSTALQQLIRKDK